MKISIIIPLYNEAQFIEELIKKVVGAELPYGVGREIIIINDGSKDQSGKILEKYHDFPGIKVFNIQINMGKTAAIRLGIEKSTGDIIVIQDADLEYDPKYYSLLIEPILKNKASVVYGSRFKGKIEGMKLINRVANIISNITLALLYGTKLSDVNTGYKVFKRDALNGLNINSNNFGFETEITAKLLNLGHKIYEVPIKYTARYKEQGKKMSWLKALQMYWGIFKYRYSLGKN
ncbi:MAG TPA: glycosyltransferase family 2 protein [Candidatus Margulisiibacteriota bacterium]|nr:glycosyltransferase family 2 protein [Candidatus Margulisiibacteriota bacterium]